MASILNRTFEYVAGRDFDFKNLRAKAGERLPDTWQHTEMVKRLREKYGDESVTRRLLNPVPEKPERKSPSPIAPSRAVVDDSAKESKRGRRGRQPR